MVQRLPATCTTLARAVACLAKTTYAVSSGGARSLRRTKSQRHPWGGTGAARGRHCHAYQRGPLAPAPALNRPQPAGASAARLGLTWGGRPARQTYSCPETALT